MLRTKLIHPEILAGLASAGHGSRVLIADGNYPFATASLSGTRKVFLNLMPGVIRVAEALEAVLSAVVVESAIMMAPPEGSSQPLQERLAGMLAKQTILSKVKRNDFYAEVRSPDTALLIATGEQQRFANILLTIGVVREDGGQE